MRILDTESGARYLVAENAIKRVGPGAKRADGEWIELLEPLPAGDLVGLRLYLVLEPLSGHGPDDYGNWHSTEPTRRLTTAVVYDSWHDGSGA